MSSLSLIAVLNLAATCAPTVAPETLLSVVRVESAMSPLVIGDNTARRVYHPSSLADAVATTETLIAQGHSLDLGIAQISWKAGHLQARGLPLSAAFDACTGLRVGSEVLTACYRRAAGVEQVRLRQALSCYNTGSLDRGTGYAARVWQAAAHVVPAIQLAGPDARGPATPEDTATPLPRRPSPGLQDALRATPAIPDPEDGMADAFHRPSAKEPTP